MARAMQTGAVLLLSYCLVVISVDSSELLERSNRDPALGLLQSLNRGEHPRFAIAVYFLVAEVMAATMLFMAAFISNLTDDRNARRTVSAAAVCLIMVLLSLPAHAPSFLVWSGGDGPGSDGAVEEIGRAFRDAITYLWSSALLMTLPVLASPKIGQLTKFATAALTVAVVGATYLMHWDWAGSRTTKELIVFTFTLAALLYLGNRTRRAIDREIQARTRAESASKEASEEKRRYAEQSEAAVAAMRAMEQRMAETNRRRMEFLAEAIHDMRQPLQSSLLYADAVCEALTLRPGDAAPEAVALHAEILLGEVRSLGKAFDAILDYSSLESGELRVHVRAYRLGDIIDELERRFVPIARRSGLKMRVVAPTRDCIVTTDRDLSLRLISNLLSNAIKYTQARSSGGRARGTHDIVIRVRVRGLLATVFVIDRGCGIPADMHQAVFEAGVQLGPMRASRDGFGLGLATVRSIVDRALPDHNISLQSIVGRGTHVMFDMPLMFGNTGFDAEADVDLDAPSLRSGRVDLLGAMIAVVEDDAPVRRAIVELLRRAGAFVLEGGSLQEMMQAIANADRYPDVILTDYKLPAEVTGCEAIRCIREQCGGRPIPALILTAYQRAAEAEADALPLVEVMRKVANPKRLLQRLSAHYVSEASPLDSPHQLTPGTSSSSTTPARAIS